MFSSCGVKSLHVHYMLLLYFTMSSLCVKDQTFGQANAFPYTFSSKVFTYACTLMRILALLNAHIRKPTCAYTEESTHIRKLKKTCIYRRELLYMCALFCICAYTEALFRICTFYLPRNAHIQKEESAYMEALFHICTFCLS